MQPQHVERHKAREPETQWGVGETNGRKPTFLVRLWIVVRVLSNQARDYGFHLFDEDRHTNVSPPRDSGLGLDIP